jgi:hypothetical protein
MCASGEAEGQRMQLISLPDGESTMLASASTALVSPVSSRNSGLRTTPLSANSVNLGAPR